MSLTSGRQLAPPDLVSKQLLTCDYCGHTGADVARYYPWAGGHGHVERVECDDQRACSARQDARGDEYERRVGWTT